MLFSRIRNATRLINKAPLTLPWVWMWSIGNAIREGLTCSTSSVFFMPTRWPTLLNPCPVFSTIAVFPGIVFFFEIFGLPAPTNRGGQPPQPAPTTAGAGRPSRLPRPYWPWEPAGSRGHGVSWATHRFRNHSECVLVSDVVSFVREGPSRKITPSEVDMV